MNSCVCHPKTKFLNHEYQKVYLEYGMSDPSLIPSSSPPLPLLSFLTTVKLIPGQTRIYIEMWTGYALAECGTLQHGKISKVVTLVKTNQNMQKHLG